jgi:ABC-type uncharacterized transport system substrate-binding protein
LKAGTDREIDAAFVSLTQTRPGPLLVGADALFNSRIEQIVVLVAPHAIPTMYSFREFVVAGGLISYGSSLTEEYRQVGLYTGRILKGERPVDLPVQQATKFELIINLKTAKALGLQVPSRSFLLAARVQLAILAARFAVPAIYSLREHAEAGGLLSYGPNIADRDREVGHYVGRILKGGSRPICRSSSRANSSS